VTKIAFGRLKARWRRLLKRNEMLVENIPNVITAACVLHNICEVHHDHFNYSWLQDSNEHAQLDTPTGPAQDIRKSLAQYFQHH